jgi:P-type conjugative transfer protein TrbJ
MMRLALVLLASSFLSSPALVGEAKAQSDAYYTEEDSPEGRRFEDAIKQTASQGHSTASIQNGFRLNGWDIDETTIQYILAGQMSGHQALKRGLITPSSVVDESVDGPTQYTGGSSYGGGGSSYDGGSISMSSIPGMACGGGQAAAAGLGAVGAIAGWFSGGRATAPLQMAQQVQLYTANACLFSQLQSQLRSLWTQMENLKNTDLSTINGTLSSLYAVRSILGSVDGATYTMNRVTGMMQDHYPETYDGMTTDEEVMRQAIIWDEAAKQATEESWKIQSAIIEHQKMREGRVSAQVVSLNRAPGMLAAQQATGNLITTLIEQAENMQTVSVAHYRAMEHQMLQDETAKQNAEELHKRRSEEWGYMETTDNFAPFAN